VAVRCVRAGKGRTLEGLGVEEGDAHGDSRGLGL
jgi:hypothetical protein